MFRKLLQITCISPFVSGCMSLPVLPTREGLDIAKIVNRVECELQDAAALIEAEQPLNWTLIKKWQAVFTLRLMVEQQTGFGPALSVTGVPFALNIFNFEGSGSFAGSSGRDVSINFFVRFRDISKYVCVQDFIGDQPLYSNLGIKEWLDRSLIPFNSLDSVAFPTLVASDINFAIDASGRFGPGVNIIGTPAVGFGGAGLLSTGRKDTHRLSAEFKSVPGQ